MALIFPPEILHANGGRLLCVRRSTTGLCTFFSTYHVDLKRLSEQIIKALDFYKDVSEITVFYYETYYDHHTSQYVLTDYQQQVTFTPQFFLP